MAEAQEQESHPSLSARRVWIEIITKSFVIRWSWGHSLRGECGLKLKEELERHGGLGHSLRGECGLKSRLIANKENVFMSLSARRVWIEISVWTSRYLCLGVTLCEESVD